MRPARSLRSTAALAPALALCALACSACGGGFSQTSARPGTIAAVGAENEYANVIEQIGGRYVSVSAVESNPNVDPHAYEASASVAQAVASAELVVQNGAGYDEFMQRLEAASPSGSRRVIVVQRLLGLPASVRNPHLWYSPRTMPALAGALASALAALQPAHASYFSARAAAFVRALGPWQRALAAFAARHRGVRVAVTEPVGDYMLEAAGARIMTPFPLQADIMNGVDPSPQDVVLEHRLLERRDVSAFLYNRQVTDTLTQTFLQDAHAARVPVVAVYETMPLHYDYQSWMLAELSALERAVDRGESTARL